jgi:hypothetical protein
MQKLASQYRACAAAVNSQPAAARGGGGAALSVAVAHSHSHSQAHASAACTKAQSTAELAIAQVSRPVLGLG